MTSAFIVSDTPAGTSMLYRSVHLKEQFEANGIPTTVTAWRDCDPRLTEEVLKADLIVLQRVDMNHCVRDLIVRARDKGKKVFFDADDLIFEIDLADRNRAASQFAEDHHKMYLDGIRGYLATLYACDYALMASNVLTNLARKRGKMTFLHRNAVGKEMQTIGDDLLHKRQQRPVDETVVIGYGSGTATHTVDFGEVVSPLVEVMQRHPQTELWIAGPLDLPVSLDLFASGSDAFH